MLLQAPDGLFALGAVCAPPAAEERAGLGAEGARALAEPAWELADALRTLAALHALRRGAPRPRPGAGGAGGAPEAARVGAGAGALGAHGAGARGEEGAEAIENLSILAEVQAGPRLFERRKRPRASSSAEKGSKAARRWSPRASRRRRRGGA
jgi:hypothetical protein